MQIGEIVRAAKTFVADMYRDEAVKDLSLEEIEKVDGLPGHWIVTISFVKPTEFSFVSSDRYYKQLALSDDDGGVLWMRIRELNQTAA